MRYAIVDTGRVANVVVWDGSTPWSLTSSQTAVGLPDGSAVGPGYTYSGGVFSAPPAPPPPLLVDYQKVARARIDADVDRVFHDVIGDRTTEYQTANSDATSFKAASYPSASVPASVQCWATVKGWTPQVACDDILSTATNWINAQQSMRANRLQKKQDVTNATTDAAVDTVLSAWATYIAGMRSQLGV